MNNGFPTGYTFNLRDSGSLRSYIMTFQDACTRLASAREDFDEQRWLIMFSNMLRIWFCYEADFVEYDQSIIKILIERNLLPFEFKGNLYAS